MRRGLIAAAAALPLLLAGCGGSDKPGDAEVTPQVEAVIKDKLNAEPNLPGDVLSVACAKRSEGSNKYTCLIKAGNIPGQSSACTGTFGATATVDLSSGSVLYEVDDFDQNPPSYSAACTGAGT